MHVHLSQKKTEASASNEASKHLGKGLDLCSASSIYHNSLNVGKLDIRCFEANVNQLA